MSHYTPASRFPTTFAYSPAPLTTPRDRYLAALAEAKAAETEYLAAEAVQREEDALRRRLEDIQLQKQDQELLLHSRYGRTPHHSSHLLSELGAYPTYGYDRLAALRRQVEEEEAMRLLAVRQAEIEQERRRKVEEAHRLSLGRQEQTRLHREREEGRVAALLERRAAKAHQILMKSAERQQLGCCGQASVQPSTQQLCGVSCQRTDLRSEIPGHLVNHPALQAFLGPEAQAFASVKPSAAQPSVEVDLVQGLLNQLLGGQMEASKPKAPVVATQNDGLEQFLGHIFGNAQKPQVPQYAEALQQFTNLFGLPSQTPQQQPVTDVSTSSSKVPSASQAGHESLQHMFDLFGLSAAKQANQQAAPQPSATSSKAPSVPAPVAEPLQQVFDMFFGQPPNKLAEVERENPAASAPPKAPEASLSQQLESRLNQEYSSEVRDTIQAIFASLQDAEPNNIGSSSAASDSARGSKGKAKAAEIPTTASPSAANATSRDVVNSMNEVHNIEAAFQALESDFTFPAHLDFLAAHLAMGSPASSDSEASATVHLAYTSRNHPVRFYEQALSALLTQLDSIDSFGNDDLRGMRKEVVDKVEKALGELEREVEGRWRTRLSKEAKPVEVEVTKLMSTQSATLSESSSSQSDFASISDVPKAVGSAAGGDTSTLSPVLEATPEVSAPAVAPSTTTVAASSPSEASVIDSTISTQTQRSPPTEISDTNEDTISTSTSLAASVLTVKGYDAEATAVQDASPLESESGDTFLLAAADADSIPKRSNNKSSDDAGSDWSEVEA